MAKDLTFSAGSHFYGADKTERKPTLLERGAHWLASMRSEQHDHEIERFIHNHGGVLTDSLEREIATRFVEAHPGRF